MHAICTMNTDPLRDKESGIYLSELCRQRCVSNIAVTISVRTALGILNSLCFHSLLTFQQPGLFQRIQCMSQLMQISLAKI